MYDINKDLKSVRHWFCRNGLILNTKRLETMITTSHRALKTNWDIIFFTETQY